MNTIKRFFDWLYDHTIFFLWMLSETFLGIILLIIRHDIRIESFPDGRDHPGTMACFMLWIFTLGPIPVSILIIVIVIAIIEAIIKLIRHLLAFSSAELNLAKYDQLGEKNMFDEKKNDLENEQEELMKKMADMQAKNPEILQNVQVSKEISTIFSNPGLKSTYDGYFSEAGKRFALRQSAKTNEAKKAVLDQAITLCKQLAEINRVLADLSQSKYELAEENERRKVTEERLRSGQIRKDIEREEEMRSKRFEREDNLFDLETQAKEEELKTKIAIAKAKRENIKTQVEKEEPKIEDIINDIKQQSISIVQAKEEIMRTYPPDIAEQIIDELERRMIEQDIQKKGRYQSGS